MLLFLSLFLPARWRASEWASSREWRFSFSLISSVTKSESEETEEEDEEQEVVVEIRASESEPLSSVASSPVR